MSINTLVLILTPFLYIQLTSQALLASEPRPAAIDVLVQVVEGAFIILAIVAFFLLALNMFIPPNGNNLGPLGLRARGLDNPSFAPEVWTTSASHPRPGQPQFRVR